ACCGMEAGLDEHAAGLDLACDLLLVELPVGTERDEGRRGLFPVAVLERLLRRLQLGPVHARILERGLAQAATRTNYRCFTHAGRHFVPCGECEAYKRTRIGGDSDAKASRT